MKPEADFFLGELRDLNPYRSSMNQEELERLIVGFNADLTLRTLNPGGFNGAIRFTSNDTGIGYLGEEDNHFVSIFYDVGLMAGLSHTSSFRNLELSPYLTAKTALMPNNLIDYLPELNLESITRGFKVDLESITAGVDLKAGAISVRPYGLWMPWEQGFGAEIRIGTENFGLNISGYNGQSTYEFAPDKHEINLEAHFLVGDTLGLNLSYVSETDVYSKESTTESSLEIGGVIKL